MIRLRGTAVGAALVLVAAQASAQTLLAQGFNDVAALAGQGWGLINNSAPAGTTNWFQGNSGVFASQAGAPAAYIASNFLAAAEGGAVSNWLITPQLALTAGDSLSFFWRTGGSGLVDGLSVYFSTAGVSTDVGTTATSTGVFNLLGGLASSTDSGWTLASFTLPAVSVGASGRYAFRYTVPDTNTAGNYIGIDTVAVTAVPEPSTLLMWLCGAAALPLLRRARR